MGFLGSAIEVMLFAFIGDLVDMMKNAANPKTFMSDNKGVLLWMGFVALIARPVVSTVHDLIKNQAVATTFTNRIRWQTHSYVLRQSLGFFQNDFAGRIANKIIQTAPALRESVVQLIDALWYAAVQFLGAFVLFAAADWRLTLPLIVWLGAYIAAISYFVPRIKSRSTETSEARSMLVGRIVDSYTNILTVKLFAHAEREDDYARFAFRDMMEKWQASLRLITGMEFALYTLNGILIVAVGGLALWLWQEGHVTTGANATVIGLVIRVVMMSGWVMWTISGIFENIGVVHEGMETISRAQSVLDAPGAKPLKVAEGAIKFDCIRFHYGGGMSGAEHQPHACDRTSCLGHCAGREGRSRRPLGGRQVDPGQPLAAVLRPRRRPHPDRRSGYCAGHARQPQSLDRRRDPGHLAPAPLGSRQHPLWPSRGQRPGGGGGGRAAHRRPNSSTVSKT